MKVMKVFIWGFVMILLTACSSTIAVPTFTNTAPSTVTATPLPPTATPTLPPTLAPTFTSTPIPPEVAGLRMVYRMIEGDNLYLWDESNPPIQLTFDERRDHGPEFTGDGEKIVFFRGGVLSDLYSINLDGSQEQLLVSNSIISQLGLGYGEFSEIIDFSLIPGTHQVLFNTLDLDEKDLGANVFKRLYSVKNDDLFLVDADTGEIQQVLERGQCEFFEISPTGDMIAVVRNGQIDLVDLDGQIIRRNVLTYLRTQPMELSPYLFWKEDGSELFVAVPVDPEYDMGGPETRTLWRIAVDGSIKTELTFDAPLVSSNYTVSPDGHWILYVYFFYANQDIGIPEGLYLGNLREGGSQILPVINSEGPWSSDSTHFLIGVNEVYLGSVDGQLDLIADYARILGWIDSYRFLFYTLEDDQIISMGDIDGTIVDIPYISHQQIGELAFTFVEPQSEP
ncbi:hypothetical protein KQH61_00550 [bacterium]|nr:hypothetical protein [bacterium]